MKKLVIVGCGRLAGIVSDAVVNGLLPEYDLVGVYSRTAEKAERIVSKMQQLNPEKPDVPLNKNDAFQKVQKRRVQEKR